MAGGDSLVALPRVCRPQDSVVYAGFQARGYILGGLAASCRALVVFSEVPRW